MLAFPRIRCLIGGALFVIAQQIIHHEIAPAAHGLEHGAQFCAQQSEGIDHARRGFGKGGAVDEAMAPETLEPMREGVGAGAVPCECA